MPELYNRILRYPYPRTTNPDPSRDALLLGTLRGVFGLAGDVYFDSSPIEPWHVVLSTALAESGSTLPVSSLVIALPSSDPGSHDQQTDGGTSGGLEDVLMSRPDPLESLASACRNVLLGSRAPFLPNVSKLVVRFDGRWSAKLSTILLGTPNATAVMIYPTAHGTSVSTHSDPIHTRSTNLEEELRGSRRLSRLHPSVREVTLALTENGLQALHNIVSTDVARSSYQDPDLVVTDEDPIQIWWKLREPLLTVCQTYMNGT